MYTQFLGLEPFAAGGKTPSEISPNDFADKRISCFRHVKSVHAVSDPRRPDIRIGALDKYRSAAWVQEGLDAKRLLAGIRANPQVTNQTDLWADEASRKVREIVTGKAIVQA
jgi:hypothetical protein